MAPAETFNTLTAMLVDWRHGDRYDEIQERLMVDPVELERREAQAVIERMLAAGIEVADA